MQLIEKYIDLLFVGRIIYYSCDKRNKSNFWTPGTGEYSYNFLVDCHYMRMILFFLALFLSYRSIEKKLPDYLLESIHFDFLPALPLFPMSHGTWLNHLCQGHPVSLMPDSVILLYPSFEKSNSESFTEDL
jgi:hypothetical protein